MDTKLGLITYNLVIGNGYSVLDLIKVFSKASGIDIPYKILNRKSVDIATCYSDSKKLILNLGE